MMKRSERQSYFTTNLLQRILPIWMAFLVIFLLTLTLTACGTMGGKVLKSSHQGWRLEKPIIITKESTHDTPVKIGVIEFDDQGEMWKKTNEKHPSQLDAVSQELSNEVAKGPVLLMIYIHGWNNNASEENEKKQGNLKSFKETLQATSATLANARVFGVYMSWRGGLVNNTNILFDYYNRDAAATRIARVGTTLAINKLCSIARQQERSKIIAVGHSMGGLILLNSIAQPLISDLARATGRGERYIKPIADTVVLVNPAENAILMRQIRQALHHLKARFEIDGHSMPYITSISSVGDWANGRFFKPVTWLGRNLFSALMTKNSGQTVDKEQEKAIVTAMGFYDDLLTHSLTQKEASSDLPKSRSPWSLQQTADIILKNVRPKDKAAADELIVHLNASDAENGNGQLTPYSLKPLKSDPLLPLWSFQVPKNVIADHGDIWTANFMGLLTALHWASDGNHRQSPRTSVERPSVSKPKISKRRREPAALPPPSPSLSEPLKSLIQQMPLRSEPTQIQVR